MRNLSHIGRVFYGIAIAVLGILTIYYSDFPYMMLPPNHYSIPGHVMATYVLGAILSLAGICIVFEKKIRPVSLTLGIILLLIFCFYFIPYQFISNPNYMHFGEWENAAKELALAAGALVIADCFPGKNIKSFGSFLEKLISLGAIFYAITILSFGIDHFLFAHEASDYVPAWIPYHLFWMYVTGTALLGSSIAIMLKIKIHLFATLLGAMTFTWFVILHVPRVISSPRADLSSEIASAFLALAYSGTAFVIAGASKSSLQKEK